MTSSRWITLVLVSLLSLSSWAQDQGQHPRVSELEDKLKNDATNYLEGRFPGLPFSVSVDVDPLRRSFGGRYEAKGEVLPYYALDEENIKDEWDDPTTTLYSLISRVKKIKIQIQVPETVKAEELIELKESVVKELRLLPARDEIEVVTRQWTVVHNIKYYLIIIAAALLLYLMGLFIISRITVARMSSVIQGMKPSSSVASGPSVSRPSASVSSEGKRNVGGQSDIRFNDPIKTREVINSRLTELIENDDLLRLENIIKLDSFGKENPQALGALLSLFPMDIQRQLFALSHGTHWMEAFSDPGELSMGCMDVAESISRVKTTEFRKNWERLLIQIWRMDEQAIGFLKDLKFDQAMTILNAMPKSISVPLGRQCFPGKWAALLDSNFSALSLSETECLKLYEKGLEVLPLVEFEVLDVYKRDRELLKFVEIADVRTEEEIYQAVPEGSMLETLRPPFYKVFDQEERVLKALVPSITIDDWAISLLNVDRDLRKVVDVHFSEKEKFFFLEKLKVLDQDRPTAEEMGAVRGKIGALIDTMLKENRSKEESADSASEALFDLNAEGGDRSEGVEDGEDGSAA